MRGVFDDREVQQAEPRHDTELTLGSTTLLLIFFGLVLLCGLCFGLGYATGHRGTQETAAALPSAASTQTEAPIESGTPKPSADALAGASGLRLAPASDQPATPAPDTPDANVQNSAPAAASSPTTGQTQVKPAFENAVTPVQAGQLPAAAVMPAMGSLMVQIAAVSQPEDADVLMSALRRRGYAVAARREPLDGLIHVRIGPFKTRDEAETWRLKLLNDGYNAIVQP
jgi:cell division septation protein DedD